MARRSKEQIEDLVRQYRERGAMTRREFCESRGMPLSVLDYYLRRYGRATRSVKLARVKIQAPERVASFALVLANGRRIECGEEGLWALLRLAERA